MSTEHIRLLIIVIAIALVLKAAIYSFYPHLLESVVESGMTKQFSLIEIVLCMVGVILLANVYVSL